MIGIFFSVVTRLFTTAARLVIWVLFKTKLIIPVVAACACEFMGWNNLLGDIIVSLSLVLWVYCLINSVMSLLTGSSTTLYKVIVSWKKSQKELNYEGGLYSYIKDVRAENTK